VTLRPSEHSIPLPRAGRPGQPSRIQQALAKNRLGVPAVVFFVLASAAPLTVVAGAVTTGYGVTGVTAIPVAFIAVALVLALFAVGYVAMARGFGVLILLTFTSVAVTMFFARERRRGHPDSRWCTAVAPILAAACLLGVLGLALGNFATLLGVDPASSLRWQLPALYLPAAAAGAAWALVLRRRRPAVYEAIGLGANAVAGRAASSSAAGPPARHADLGMDTTGVVR
jgi:hypothetical protein